MMPATRPLPDTSDPLTAPFWAATLESRMLVQSCDRCGYLRWPPGPLCPECQHPAATWKEVRPAGTVWSLAVYWRALDQAFAGDVPYTVGLVELADGPRMYGRVQGEPGTTDIGDVVRAVFKPAAPGVNLVEWAAAAGRR